METINSMASSAAKVIWGGENNTDNTATDKENQKPGTETTDTTTSPNTTTTTTMSNETQGQEPVSGKLGDTSKEAGNTAQAETKTGGPTTEHPSTTGDSGFKAAQADVRDPDTNATTDPKKEAERKNVDDTGSLDASENPAKVDGPGPRPLEEVAREHGGDVGKSNEAVGGDALGGKGGAEDSKEGEEDQGSGEKYVKTTGLQADGGDFDATKPGAGREADRLLEEKGIANPATAAASGKKSEDEAAPTDSPDSGKEKKSLKDKIKAKLHKN